MPSDVYQKLRDQLDQYSVGFPASESGVELKMLRKLFTEEEAELYLYLTMRLETSEAVAQRTGRNPEKTAKLLENMAEKGLIFRYRKNDLKKYGAAPFVLGIYEYQLNRLDPEFARMFEDYLHDSFHKTLTGSQTLLRPIPVNRSVEADLRVAPYEDAREILNKQKKIAIADCICQVQQDLIDQGCDKPREVCFLFGSTAQYFIDRGMGRRIDVDEAMQILDKCQEAGLVVQPASAQNPGGMCNCCGDCCALLRTIKKFPRPAEMVLSNYFARVDRDDCTACETCLERCQMEAITVDEAARVDTDRCIGCGLCVTTCPTGAVHMIRKPEDQIVTPPETGMEVMMDLARSRGTELTPLALL